MKILIVSSIYSEAIEALESRHDVTCAFNADDDKLKKIICDQDVVVFRSGVQITADVMRCAPHLQLLVRAGSGLDNLDIDYVQTNKLTLVRIPEPAAKAVAELTFGLMLMLSRHILQADHQLRKGRWVKNEITGHLLTGKTLGIVGAGNIGSHVGQLGVAWGMNVTGCVRHPSTDRIAALHEKGIRLTNFEEVLETADYVSIHVPLNESTCNLVSTDELTCMKPGTFLTNLARGGVVDEQALYRELTMEGRLAGAAMDVHQVEGEGKTSPLASLTNVVLTPHIGATTIDTQREIGDRIVEIVESFDEEGDRS